MFRLWRIRWPTADLPAAQLLLDESERERAARYRVPQAAERFTICRALLKILLAGELNTQPTQVAISSAADGKPYLDAAPRMIAFNQSHSGDWLLVAMRSEATGRHAGEIGCDIECYPSESDTRTLEMHFSNQEREAIRRASDPDRLRIRLWVYKEAIAKASGDPVPHDFASQSERLEATFRGLGNSQTEYDRAIRRLKIAALELGSLPAGRRRRLAELDLGPNFVAAVCWDGGWDGPDQLDHVELRTEEDARRLWIG